METESRKQKKGIPRWIWVLIALVVTGALVAGISAFFAQDRTPTEPPPPASSSSASAGGADGCIAGRDNDAESLVAGAHEQAQTEAGAAAVAAGFLRFTYSYPWPSEDELTTVFSELSVTEDAREAARSARSASGPETARTAGLSFADARYVIEPGSTSEQVRVSVAAQAVTDGTLNGLSMVMTVTMNWDDGVWRFADLGEESNESEILSNGAAFVGGC